MMNWSENENELNVNESVIEKDVKNLINANF
jgi:predicted transcriptional regulator